MIEQPTLSAMPAESRVRPYLDSLSAMPVLGALGVAAAISIVLGGFQGVLLMFAAILAIPLITRPFAALNMLLIFAAFDAINTLVPSEVYTVTATKLVGYVLGAALLIDLSVRRAGLRVDASLMCFGALIIAVLASAWVATNMDLLINDTLRLVQLGILFVAVRELVTTPERRRIVATTIFVSLSVGAAIALFEAVQTAERIAGVSQNAAILAADLFLALAIGFALFRTAQSGWQKWALGLALFIIGWVLALTETRAAFLALIPAAFAAFLASRRIGRFTLTLMGLLLVAFVAFGGMTERLAMAAAATDGSTQVRLRTAYAGVRLFEENPLLGAGFGNFREHYLRLTNDPKGDPKTAHNSYLSFAAETGLPGLFAWCGFLIACIAALWVAARRARREGWREELRWHSALLFAVTGLAFMALFHTLHFSKYFWVLLALASTSGVLNAVVASRLADEQQSVAEHPAQ